MHNIYSPALHLKINLLFFKSKQFVQPPSAARQVLVRHYLLLHSGSRRDILGKDNSEFPRSIDQDLVRSRVAISPPPDTRLIAHAGLANTFLAQSSHGHIH